MKSLTQEKTIIKKLLTDGSVSRNWALQNYISRLGAIMLDLKKDGWAFTGGFVKRNNGKDYVYSLVGVQPLKLEKYYVAGELVGTKIIRS